MTEPRDSYSPERRTALLFTGTGADGAYHAGAMRALQEAGVKIDIVGGRGIGAVSAVLAAVDGSAQLWDDGGFWRSGAVADLYRWRWPFRALRLLGIALIAVLAVPAGVLLLAIFVYPIALVLGMAGLQSGSRLVEFFLAFLGVCLRARRAAIVDPTAVAAAVHRGVDRARGGRLAGAISIAAVSPVDGQLAVDAARAHRWTPVCAIGQATEAVWRLLKGSATIRTPDPRISAAATPSCWARTSDSRDFGELLLVAHDLDAHRDLVFGLVRDPFRRALFPPPGRHVVAPRRSARPVERGAGFVADVLAAALSVPGVSDPRLVEFAPDAYWRGETHRLIDRPASFGRLLEESAAAGAEQVVIVAAAADPPGPHELRPPRLDGLGRVGEHIASAETAAVADAIRHLHHRFQSLYRDPSVA